MQAGLSADVTVDTRSDGEATSGAKPTIADTLSR